jgi:hypothetical protein
LVECPPQTGAFLRIDRRDEAQASGKMRPKIRMALVVLTGMAKANAVGEDRLEPIEIRPHNIDALIRHKAGYIFSNPLPLICAVAQQRSRDEMPVRYDSPG